MISTMTWQVVNLKDIPPTPWRNGGGTTRELLTWPQADNWAEADIWQWRVSVAEVTQAGPFSSFSGVQRWFAVLEGDGVCLTVGGKANTLVRGDAPFAFDGAVPVTCELLGGATQDFNLMVQADVSAHMRRVNDSFDMMTNAPKIIAAYTHNEGATMQIGSEFHALSPHSFGWMYVQANTPVHVQASDALLMDIEV